MGNLFYLLRASVCLWFRKFLIDLIVILFGSAVFEENVEVLS